MTAWASQVLAQPPGTFSLPTISVTDCALPVVNISTTSAGGTLGYDFDITFNSSVLSVTSVVLGTLTSNCEFAWNANDPGVLAISVACTQEPPPGSGTVAAIQFAPAGVGTSPLTFTTCSLDEEDCTNPVNGQVQISGCPTVNLTNSGRGTYGLSPGRVCVSGILASNGASVISASNELTFNSSIFAIESCFANSTLVGKSLSRTVLGPGMERVTISGGTGVLPNGILYACTLTIVGSTPNGSYVVDNNPAATGPGAVPLPTMGADGIIHVTSCGADCDGAGSPPVAIGEVSRTSALFLGDPLCNATNVNLSCPNADTIGNDGTVSIGEVTRASCLFLNGICSRTCP